MKVIKTELSRELTAIEIVPLADLHLGDPLCDVDLIKEKIKYIAETSNAYAVLNGDIINNSTKNSVGDVYSEKLSPMEQLQQAIDLLTPIKDKILAVTSGNHEARSYKGDGIDLTCLLCKQLNLYDKYSRESALLFLRFGTLSNGHKESRGSGKVRMASYTLFIIHGTGGGRNEGSKATRLGAMMGIVDADIYIHSHTHLPMVMKQGFHRVDIQNSKVAIVDKLFVNTNAYLNYGGYGETFEFKAASKDCPHIFLSGRNKKFTAKL